MTGPLRLLHNLFASVGIAAADLPPAPLGSAAPTSRRSPLSRKGRAARKARNRAARASRRVNRG
jgi:hypothetical protein